MIRHVTLRSAWTLGFYFVFILYLKTRWWFIYIIYFHFYIYLFEDIHCTITSHIFWDLFSKSLFFNNSLVMCAIRLSVLSFPIWEFAVNLYYTGCSFPVYSLFTFLQLYKIISLTLPYLIYFPCTSSLTLLYFIYLSWSSLLFTLQSSEFTKNNKLYRLAGLSLAQLSPGLFFLIKGRNRN